MKLFETTEDQKTVRLGIVKLGTAVGKTKYALIDEVDIPLIHDYKFDARLEIDRNGDGIRVIAMGHPKSSSSGTKGGTASPIPLHNILWEHHHGTVELGYEVRHLNGITMDNRMDNLSLVPKWVSKSEQDRILQSRSTESHFWENNNRRRARIPMQHGGGGGGLAGIMGGLGGGMGGGMGGGIMEEDNMLSDQEIDEPPPQNPHNPPQQQQQHQRMRGVGVGGGGGGGVMDDKSERRKGENSLYWKAITQLLANETEEQRNAGSAPCSRAYYTTEGELISRDSPSFYFFECHYAPCTAIESEPREFAMCGRCQQARYCGRECQRDDWQIHRDHCNEVRRGSSSSSCRALRRRRELPKSDADR